MKNSVVLATFLSLGLLISGCGMMHKGHHSCCAKKESCCAEKKSCKNNCTKCKDGADCSSCKDCGNSKCGGGECDIKDEPKKEDKKETKK